MHGALGLLSVAVALLLTTSLTAFETPPRSVESLIKVTAAPVGARLTLGARVLAIFRTANAGLTAVERADLAAKRLELLVAAGLRPHEVRIEPRGDQWALLARGTLVMLATEAEAAERREVPESTARRWLENLRAALAHVRSRGLADGPAPARRDAAAIRTPRPAVRPPGTEPGRATPGTQAPIVEARSIPLDAGSSRPETGSVRPETATLKPQGRNPGAPGVRSSPGDPETEPAKPENEPAKRAPRSVRLATAAVAAAPPSEASPLKTGIRSLVVPYGETRTVSVEGGDGPLQVRIEGDSVAAAEVGPGRTAITVRGLNPGRAVVRVGQGEAETAFAVWVKKYAGSFPPAAAAQVTGDLAPGSLVRRVAIERVLDETRREPGASLELLGEPEGVKALGRGAKTTVQVPVSIAGEGMLEQRATVRVEVQNIALPSEETRVLLYSNNPESVREMGTLFEGLVPQDGPARLLFHHQNRLGRMMTFQIFVVNPRDSPADVQLVGGEAGPFIDPVQAGHRAGQRYLSAIQQDLGLVARIPGRSARVLVNVRVGRDQTISGIYTLRILGGGPLVTQVVASEGPASPTLPPNLVERARLEPHTYPTPQKSQSYEYRVGQRWAFIHVGRVPIQSGGKTRRLDGNYGVLYRVTVELHNPTDTAQTVRLLMSPDAGLARGVFIIDGQLIEAPQISPPIEAELWKKKLEPGERRRLTIEAMPVGGSNYPISLVVRS